ncbi:MAG: signal peptidase I [Lachnospiraceae bacterium]|nr:signal peptidase I [Lachnospiraceae bacterium]
MFKRKQTNGLVFYEKKKLITARQVYAFISWVAIIAGAILMAYVMVFAFGVRTTIIGDSMEPSLVNGQEIMINRLVYNIFEPGQGDVVVFKPNGNENAHTYVKRVVAVPGDTVRIMDGILYVNNEPTEFYSDNIANPGIAALDITVGEDEFFVMGDNPNSSDDSRNANIGNVKLDTIIGKAWFHMAGGTEGLGRIH